MNTSQFGIRYVRTSAALSTVDGWKTMLLYIAADIRVSNAKRAEKHGSSIDQMSIIVLKDPQKISAVQALLKQGCSIRKISQTVRLSPGTVQRWKTKFK